MIHDEPRRHPLGLRLIVRRYSEPVCDDLDVTIDASTAAMHLRRAAVWRRLLMGGDVPRAWCLVAHRDCIERARST